MAKVKNSYKLSYEEVLNLFVLFLEDREIFDAFSSELSRDKHVDITNHVADNYHKGGAHRCLGIIDYAFSWHLTDGGYNMWAPKHAEWQAYLRSHIEDGENGKPFSPRRLHRLYNSIW